MYHLVCAHDPRSQLRRPAPKWIRSSFSRLLSWSYLGLARDAGWRAAIFDLDLDLESWLMRQRPKPDEHMQPSGVPGSWSACQMRLSFITLTHCIAFRQTSTNVRLSLSNGTLLHLIGAKVLAIGMEALSYQFGLPCHHQTCVYYMHQEINKRVVNCCVGDPIVPRQALSNLRTSLCCRKPRLSPGRFISS